MTWLHVLKTLPHVLIIVCHVKSSATSSKPLLHGILMWCQHSLSKTLLQFPRHPNLQVTQCLIPLYKSSISRCIRFWERYGCTRFCTLTYLLNPQITELPPMHSEYPALAHIWGSLNLDLSSSPRCPKFQIHPPPNSIQSLQRYPIMSDRPLIH